MEVKYEFSPKEISHHMRVIGETFSLGSRPTETFSGKRLFQQSVIDAVVEFMPKGGEEAVRKLIGRCKYVYSHCIKENVTLTLDEIKILRLLLKWVTEV